MKGLYQGRYIIAVYDNNDYLIEVACSPTELKCYANKRSAKSAISHIASGVVKGKNIYLIDVTEKQDDIFVEEDKLFLDYIEETRSRTNAEKAKALGISERTYYKKKQVFNSLVTK